MTDTQRRVAMIGLDAVDLDFVRSNLAALPNLRRALECGVTRPLHSTADELAGSVWPTFYTRTRPGQHGLYHHLQWDASSMQMRRASEDWLYSEPFWYELGRRGLRTVALDVPMTFRPRPINGTEIISWGSHDELRPFSSCPPELGRQVRARFGRHPMGYEFPLNKTAGVLEQVRQGLVEGARRKGELAAWLAAEPWDFFIAVFGEAHRGGHLLWPSDGIPPTALLDVYQAIDGAVGTLIDRLTPAAHVYLFAVHGMGPNHSQEHLLPILLKIVNARFTGTSENSGGGRSRSLIPWLRQNLPPGVQNAIARMVTTQARDSVMNHSIIDGHDWTQTPALAVLADLSGYVRFNIRGREQRGMLDGDDAVRTYREELVGALRSYRLPDGTPLVRDVIASSSMFSGGRSNLLPDLIVKWTPAPLAAEVQSDTLPGVRSQPITTRVGNHRADGFCIELSPDIQHGATAEAKPIWELAAYACQSLLPATSAL